MQILKVTGLSVFSFVVLFLIARLSGRRQITQLDVFDYITGITIGSIAAELAFDTENALNELIAMLVYGALTVLLNIITDKSRRAQKLINGSPLVVFDKNVFIRGNMKKAMIDLAELLAMLRAQGYFDLAAVETAVFETTGSLSVLPVAAKRPVAPEDMGLAPAQEPVWTEFIMDGKVMERNLRDAGYDGNWLKKRLLEQGCHSPEEVFLAVWDGSGQLRLYKAG